MCTMHDGGGGGGVNYESEAHLSPSPLFSGSRSQKGGVTARQYTS